MDIDQREHASGAQPIPAATLIVFRRDPTNGPAQILLVERSGAMAFAGGATVFPGGRVDEADRVLAGTLAAGVPDPGDRDDLAARIAAIRETLEETGLAIGFEGDVDGRRAAQARKLLLETGRLDSVLEAFRWTLRTDLIVPFARWLPNALPRVFDTRFYLADLGTGDVEVAADETENRHLFWASAAEALDLADRGAIKILFPTRRNLERIACFSDFETCRQHALETPVMTITPQKVTRGGIVWLTIPSGLGYPVDGEPLSGVTRS